MGAGRKPRDTTQPKLLKALEALIEPTTRGGADDSVAVNDQEYVPVGQCYKRARARGECDLGAAYTGLIKIQLAGQSQDA